MKASFVCRHCGAKLIFENVDEPVDCSLCKRPWLVNEAGILVKLYRPPDKRKGQSWLRGKR